MLRTNVWLAVGILAVGCSSTDGEQAAVSWPVKAEVVAASEPTPPAEPAEPSGLEGVTILRASADDPFYNHSIRFYRDTPRVDGEIQCAGLRADFDLPVKEDRIIVLPRSLTRTDEVYGLEIKKGSRLTSWVWESRTGVVWATTLPEFGPFSSDRQLKISFYPYSSEMPEQVRDGMLEVLGGSCGPIPQELTEQMESLPAEIDIEVHANGTTNIVKMALDDTYIYREIQ